MIGTRVSHYRILEHLGEGGFGSVYKAEDESIPGRYVAIKFLKLGAGAQDKERKRRFLIEAKAAAALDHPSIADIIEFDETDDGMLFISMKFYEGETLHTRMSKQGSLSPVEALSIASQIASGLEHAHKKRILNRDLKPSNIILTNDGVKIIDFGLAKLLDSEESLNTTGPMGTVPYMSPEVIEGKPVDDRTDLWSLGVMLYEMFSHERPFREDSQHELMRSIRRQEPIPLRSVSKDLPENCYRIVERSLQKEPERRYQSATEFLAHLSLAKNALDSAETIDDEEIPPLPTPPRWHVGTLGVLSLVLITVVGWQLLKPKGLTSPYTTEIRAAVLPFENLTGPENDNLAAGFTALISELLEDAATVHPSMWVTPSFHTARSDVDATSAADILGVNQTLEGSLQRFQDGFRLHLVLSHNGETTDRNIDFKETDVENLARTIQTTLTGLFNFSPETLKNSDSLPTNSETILPYLRAYPAAKRGDEEALETMRSVIASSPEFPDARLCLGEGLVFQSKQWGEKPDLGYIQGILSPIDSLSSAKADRVLAKAELASLDTLSAIKHFLSATQKDPGDCWSAAYVAILLRGSDRFDEALSTLTRLRAYLPDQVLAYRYLANHYYAINNEEAALGVAQEGLRYAPDDASCINLLGAIYFEMNEWDKAREFAIRSFRLNPNCQNASNIGNMYFYAGSFTESAEYYEYAKAYCDSTDYDVLANLATSLFWIDSERDRALDYFDRAIALAEEALTQNPNDVSLRLRLADYYGLSGNLDQAQSHLDLVGDKPLDDEQDLYRKGCVLEHLGDRDGAVKAISEAVRKGLPLPQVEGTPELKNLREDLRFKTLVSEVDSLQQS